MAQLLSVRSLESGCPIDTITLEQQLSQNGFRRNLSDDQLLREENICISFHNAGFQGDESIEQHIPPDFRHSSHNNNQPKRSLTPSDSGIHIPYDVSSIRSKKSFDSGLDEPTEPNGKISSSSGDTLVTKKDSKDQPSDETLLSICIQIMFPFLVAGVGTCGAGLVLDFVEKWEVFIDVKELFILVPTLLGLKGNLEMTLASRVSTQANLGQLDSSKEQWRMCWGNMALVQCQATLLSLTSSCCASAISSADKGFDLSKALLLCASALFTASIASFLLGAVTLAVVLVSHRFHINPDNVATPIAASLGDVTTMGILASIASYLHHRDVVSSSVCLGVFVALVPLWMILSYRNSYVKSVLFHGWTPVILAVAITSAGGYILEYSVGQFEGFAIFQPVINGVAGNLVAVQASRISTYFHRFCEPGSRPPDGSNLCISPFSSYFGSTPHAKTAKILLALVIPGHILFGYAITLAKGGETALTITFLPIYLATAFIQVAFLLYVAQCLIHVLWRRQMDPDNWSIPLLTALGDLTGMVALTSAFYLHGAIVKN